MPNLLRPPNLPSLSGPTSIIIPHGPPRAGKVLFFLLLIGVGALFLYSAITSPTPTTADAPTLRISATPATPAPTIAYQLPQEDWQRLAIEGTAVALQLAEIDGRLQSATNIEREQLQNDRTRLQNAAAALEITRSALDAHNAAAATASAISANATANAQNAAYIARATAVSIEGTAEAGQIARQHERAAAQLAQAKADTAAAQAATTAAMGQLLVWVAIAIGAAITIAAIAALAIALATHGKRAWIEANAALPPTAAALPLPRQPTTTDDEAAEAFARLLDEMNREAEAKRRPPTPHRTPTAASPLRPSPPVTDASVTVTDAITDENRPLLAIKPIDQYTEAEKRRVLDAYNRHGSRPTPAARQIFGDASGRRNALILAIVDEFTSGGD